MNRRFSFLSAFALLIAACEAVAPLDDVEVAADASDSADAGLPPGPDGMIAPDPDAAAPTPDAAAPVPDAALPIPDAAAPAPDEIGRASCRERV